MSTFTIELPDFLQRSIETLAAEQGFSVGQFLTSAAEEKVAAMTGIDFLRQEAAQGRRQDFEHYLAAVPDAPPADNDGLK